MLLKEKYQKQVLPELKKKFGFKNNLAAPRLIKVVVNAGIGRIRDDKQAVQEIEKVLSIITGQKPLSTKSKKAISSFKTRIGMVIGKKTTLRGKRMYDFAEKLINVALPRVRDFRGLDSKSVDYGGNLTIGFKEHNAISEIAGGDFKRIFSFEI